MIADYLAKVQLFSRDVRLLMLVYGVMGFGYVGVYAVLYNLYLLRLGYDPETIGQINAIGRLAFGLAGIPAGLLGVRYGARRLLLLGELVCIVGLLGGPLVEFLPVGMQTTWLAVTCALSFGGATLFFVNSLPVTMDATTDVERRHVLSLMGAVVPLFAFVGSLTGGALPGWIGALLHLNDSSPVPYRWALLFGGAIFLLTIPLVLAIHAGRGTGYTPAQVTTDDDLPLFTIAMLSLVAVFGSTGIGATGAFFNVYLDHGLGSTTKWIGAITASSQFVAVPAATLMPILASHLGNRRAYMVSLLGVALWLLPLGLVPTVAVAGIGLIGVSACAGIVGPLFNLYSQINVPARWRSLMSGCSFTAMGGSWALTAFLGGWAIEPFGYPVLFLGAAVTTALGAALFTVVSRVIESRCPNPDGR
jgi:MFS family permease